MRTASRWQVTLTSKPVVLAVSLACTVLALWMALRQQDLRELWQALTSLPAWPFVLSFFGLCVGTLIRAVRFYLLTRRTKSDFLASLEMILIGYVFTTLLPLRAGELVRIGYFSRRANVPVMTTTSAIALERAFDLVALALLGSIFLSALVGRQFTGLPLPPWALGAAAGLSVIGALVVGLVLRRRVTVRPPAGRLARLAHEFLAGLSSLGHVGDAAVNLALSVALWLVVSLSIQTAFHAVNVSLPFADAAVIMLGTCFAIALPAAPGFIGTYHLGFVAGALLVGIPREISLPVGIVLHLVIQVPFLPIGGAILFTGGRQALARPAGAGPA